MAQLFRRRLGDMEYELEQFRQRLARGASAAKRFNEWLQRLDDLQAGVVPVARGRGRGTGQVCMGGNLTETVCCGVRPASDIGAAPGVVPAGGIAFCGKVARHRLESKQNGLAALETRLRLLGAGAGAGAGLFDNDETRRRGGSSGRRRK